MRIVPANEADCSDLDEIFGTRGDGARCRCQRYKLAPRESFKSFPVSERVRRQRAQTGCGKRDADGTSGLVAYVDGEPAGWCAVEPRTAYSGLLRVFRTPWEGRNEDRSDASVWAVTCVFARAGFRGRGIAHALVAAAVEHARRGGAAAVEGYPILTEPGQGVVWDDAHVGTREMFESAGFAEVSHPSKRRVVMRISF